VTLVQDIYESLLKDPDLEIRESQTREEAAENEAEFRARQYHNNVEALSLANEPLKENSINKLISFIETPTAQSIKKVSIEKALPPGAVYSSKQQPPEGAQTHSTDSGTEYWIPGGDEKKETTNVVEPKTETPEKTLEEPDSVDEQSETPVIETSTPPPTTKEKLDKVMEAQFGPEWKEDADAQLILHDYKENPKQIDADYKKEVLAPIKAKRKSELKQKEAESQRQESADKKAEVTAEKQKVKETQSKEKQQEREEKSKDKHSAKVANKIPSKSGDLDALAEELEQDKSRVQKLKGMFGEKTVGSVLATKHARELIAHQKNHSKYMTEDSKRELADALEESHRHGADFDLIQQEQKEHGDNFGSPDHLREANNKAIKQTELHENHEELVSGDSEFSQSSRKEAFERSQANKFTEFDDNGNPKHDTHIESNDKGKMKDFDDNEKVSHGSTKKSNNSTETNSSLSDHQLLHTLDPMQQKHVEDLKNAKNSGDKEAESKAAKALEDSGIDPKDVSGENDSPVSGPPDPEVAKRKQAEGYVWHEETRHWIKKDTLKGLAGSHSGHDAALVSGKHSPNPTDSPFALNEHGEVSDNQFVFHNGNVHKVGTGESPKGGVMHHSNVTGNALHSNLSSSGKLKEHQDSGGGLTSLTNFTNPNTGSGKNTGLKGPEGIKPSGIKESFLDGWRKGRLNKSFEPSGKVSLFYKQYNTHDRMKSTSAVQDLLEFFDEPHIHEKKKRKKV